MASERPSSTVSEDPPSVELIAERPFDPTSEPAGTQAVAAPSKREFAFTLLISAVVCGIVLVGVAGPVWLGIGPVLVGVAALIIGAARRPARREPGAESLSQDDSREGDKSSRPVTRDALTGLATRDHLEEKLQELASLRERYGQPYALVAIDISGLRFVNERHGYEAGDEVLRQTASALANAVRDVDTIARIGGDEFGVAVPMQTAMKALQMGTRLASSLRVATPDGTSVEFRIGIAESDEKGTRPALLLSSAVAAAERARHAPGRIVVVPEAPPERFRRTKRRHDAFTRRDEPTAD